MGRLQDPVAGSPWEQMMGRSKDVGRRSNIFSKLNTHTL